jgi:hypothetical protein
MATLVALLALAGSVHVQGSSALWKADVGLALGAVVDGRVIQDGRGVARQDVTLYRKTHGTQDIRADKSRTDARGTFVFHVSKPGVYNVMAGVFVDKKDVPQAKWVNTSSPFAGLNWNKPCRPAAPGVDQILNTAASDKATGAFRGFVIAVGSKTFRVQPGAHITRNLAFTCE